MLLLGVYLNKIVGNEFLSQLTPKSEQDKASVSTEKSGENKYEAKLGTKALPLVSQRTRRENTAKSPGASQQEISTATSEEKLDKHELAETRANPLWYVAFYRRGQYTGLELDNCGRKEKPCFFLQTVLNQLHEGDTVVLTDDQTNFMTGKRSEQIFLANVNCAD